MKYGLKSSKQRKYGGKQIIIIFSCKKLSHMKYSEDYENIIILITVALWEVCFRMFSFIQIPEVGGHCITMVTGKECLE